MLFDLMELHVVVVDSVAALSVCVFGLHVFAAVNVLLLIVIGH